ncbi:MAG: Mfa1 family fimbria major subunit [Tannerellaceae bacterium]|nr:Mfa1 family fimbria major subunit [Tannerellaceae bacterium]
MKKNWIKILGCIAISFATILTSCNKDNDVAEDNEPDVSGEPMMFSALISNISGDLTSDKVGGTRAAGDDEDKVTDIRVVLFDTGINGAVRYSWDMGIQYTGSGFFGPDVADSDVDNFTTTARLVDKQNYHMVVLVNASDELREATTVGKSKITFEAIHESNNLKALVGQTSGSVVAANTSTSYRLFMTNADSYIFVDEDINLKPTKEEAEAAPVTLKVERAVAKVVVLDALPSSHPDYDVASLTWKLDITNKKTYWMRKPGYTAGGGTESASTSDYNRYAVDPNFEEFSGKDMTDLADEFNYITKSDIPTTQTWRTGFWEYAMENTMDAEEQMQDVTTRVIVSANYVPLKADIKDGTIAPGDSYYTYMGYYISQTQMTAYEASPSAIPEYYPLLHKAIADAKTAGNALDGSDDSFSVSGLNYYKGGISYYKILIRHFDNSQVTELMGYGRYGVVRNNLYQVSINSFSGAGEVDIPGPGPGPDEDEENWISAEVEIKPWVPRTQDNDL